MNRMLKRAKGDIIVILQDWTEIPSTAIETIIGLHSMNDKVMFTYPLVKVDDLKDETAQVRTDWRWGCDQFVPFYQWESDFASAPLQAFKDIGGYDEEFDKGWSWDNVNVAHRAKMAGYAFRCYPEIWGKAWDHDKFTVHPFRGKNENGELSKNKDIDIELGNWKLNYL